MRSLFFLFSFATLALGCGPGPDPALGECSVRKDGAVLLGTGEDEFQAISSAGVRVNFGNQGGQHIWLGLSCKNLGPRVAAHFKITDVATGIEITEHGLSQVVELEYDGDGSDLGYGIYGYLELIATDVPGYGGLQGFGLVTGDMVYDNRAVATLNIQLKGLV